MNNRQLQEIIEDEKASFLNNIAIELEESHDKWFENFGFPIFGETSKDYHEQVYFQSYLESYTRKMINGILERMFEDEMPYETHWPELEYHGIYNGYTNTEYEEEFGFEFIESEHKIGYRYTNVDINDIDSIFAKYDVNKIVIVLWDSSDYGWYSYEDNRINVCSLKEFFKEVFSEDEPEEIDIMYGLFIKEISDAVKQAKEMISLVTLPGFTTSYIYKTKPAFLTDLTDEIKKLSSFYVKNEKYKQTEIESKKLLVEYDLSKKFIAKGLGKLFIGTSQFAKSFMTSEYLYHYFSQNPMFDYTPIVSGYIKSIEQILNTICVSYRNSKNLEINMHSYTMGSYIKFLEEHTDIWEKEIRSDAGIIIKCLESYKSADRNHLFHKDYFFEWERVEQIRKNTIFLYAVLWGAVNQDIFESDTKALGLIDEEYNTLFRLLDDNQERTYAIKISGKEYLGMHRLHRREGLVFNKNGEIKNKIIFKNYESEITIELTKWKMPQEIWEIDSSGSKKNKIWG